MYIILERTYSDIKITDCIDLVDLKKKLINKIGDFWISNLKVLRLEESSYKVVFDMPESTSPPNKVYGLSENEEDILMEAYKLGLQVKEQDQIRRDTEQYLKLKTKLKL